jgi:hypothetical protein
MWPTFKIILCILVPFIRFTQIFFFARICCVSQTLTHTRWPPFLLILLLFFRFDCARDLVAFILKMSVDDIAVVRLRRRSGRIGDEISFRKLDRLLTPSLAKPPWQPSPVACRKIHNKWIEVQFHQKREISASLQRQSTKLCVQNAISNQKAEWQRKY